MHSEHIFVLGNRRVFVFAITRHLGPNPSCEDELALQHLDDLPRAACRGTIKRKDIHGKHCEVTLNHIFINPLSKTRRPAPLAWRRITSSNSWGPRWPLESHSLPSWVILAKSELVMWMRGRKSCAARRVRAGLSGHKSFQTQYPALLACITTFNRPNSHSRLRQAENCSERRQGTTLNKTSETRKLGISTNAPASASPRRTRRCPGPPTGPSPAPAGVYGRQK